MISSAELRDATVTYEYSSFMRQKLHNPAVYAAINLTYSHRFGSAYTLRLYEIRVRYRRVGSTGWKSIQEWKALLGIEPAQYSAYKDLSKRVLRPAVRKVNKLPDLFLTLETQKGGRGGKVQTIRFLIKPNPQLAMPTPPPPPELDAQPLPDLERPALSAELPETTTEHEERLCALGLTRTQAAALVPAHSAAHISRNLDYVETRLQAPDRGGIENPAAYTQAAVTQDYAAAMQRRASHEEQLGQERRDLAEARRQQEAVRKDREEQERRKQQERQEQLNKAWEALSEDMKAAIEHTALDRALTESLIRQWYLEDIAKGSELRPTVRYTIMHHRNKALEEYLGNS